MKLARYSPARRTPRSASHFSISTTVMAAVPGTRIELSRPDTWARGDGMRATSSGVSPWARVMDTRLVGQAPVAVEHRLRVAGRPRGEQHHGDVRSPGPARRRPASPPPARRSGLPVAHADGVDQAGQRHTGSAQDHRRLRGRPAPGRPRPRPPGGGWARPPHPGASRPGTGPEPPTSWAAARSPPGPGGHRVRPDRRPPTPPAVRGCRHRAAPVRRPRPDRRLDGGSRAPRRGWVRPRRRRVAGSGTPPG